MCCPFSEKHTQWYGHTNQCTFICGSFFHTNNEWKTEIVHEETFSMMRRFFHKALCKPCRAEFCFDSLCFEKYCYIATMECRTVKYYVKFGTPCKTQNTNKGRVWLWVLRGSAIHEFFLFMKYDFLSIFLVAFSICLFTITGKKWMPRIEEGKGLLYRM